MTISAFPAWTPEPHAGRALIARRLYVAEQPRRYGRPRSDRFPWHVLYELLTGTRLSAAARDEVTTSADGRTPDLTRVVRKCRRHCQCAASAMAKSPRDARFASARAMVDAMQRQSRSQPEVSVVPSASRPDRWCCREGFEPVRSAVDDATLGHDRARLARTSDRSRAFGCVTRAED